MKVSLHQWVAPVDWRTQPTDSAEEAINEDEVNIDLWIYEALLDPVIDMLIDVERGEPLGRNGRIH